MLIGLIFSTAVQAQNPKQYYKAGLDFVEMGNFQDAIEQFTKAVDLDPKYTPAYVERGKADEKLNDIAKAYEDFKRALVFEQKDPDIYYYASDAAYKLGKFDEARDYINSCLDLKSKYLEAYHLQAQIYMELGDLDNAMLAARKALALKDNEWSYYYHGQVCEKQNDLEQAETDYKKSISKEKNFIKGYLALASVQIKLNKTDEARENCNKILEIDPDNEQAFLVRSKVYVKTLEYPKAIDDISKIILMKPDNKEFYFIRGNYYQDFTQHQNAINDFTKVLLIDDKYAEAYYKRAYSYEQIGNFKQAIKDYNMLTKLSEYDVKAKKLLASAKARLFELNRETNKPKIVLLEPVPFSANSVNVPENKKLMAVRGKIIDESDIKSLQVDHRDVPFVKTDDGYEFTTNVDVSQENMFTIAATDVYDNLENTNYTINRTEINPPLISIIAPVVSDDSELYLDNNNPEVYIEGKISDESLIKSILIDGVSASYMLDEKDPHFTATLNIANKSKITVEATDQFGNVDKQDFVLNREGVSMLENNPMGKTWAIFIENSNYETFASLDGPPKDITLMRSALTRYKIQKVIHKKDLTKKEMERFFSIELRDLVKSNHVNALLIWYAGHGKFINETGYWIPIDAKRDDEFTYFNINALRASLQSYINVTHTLVVTDACESGPTFYQAMRGNLKIRSCNDWEATKFKSSQVFSSAGYELAVDNSQFTRTFANTLANNPDACIPIETIVQKVTVAVEKNNQQKPKFGKIAGLEDENGTFFFMAKDQ